MHGSGIKLFVRFVVLIAASLALSPAALAKPSPEPIPDGLPDPVIVTGVWLVILQAVRHGIVGSFIRECSMANIGGAGPPAAVIAELQAILNKPFISGADMERARSLRAQCGR